MKKLFKPRTETIEFKTFCSSGSPEFIAAKKKVNDLFKEQQKNSPYHRRTITAYSLYLNPLALFDVHFMLAAGAVVLIAVLEKKLAENGIEFAAILSGFLHVAFPLVAFGSLLVLISKLGVFP